MTPQTFRGKTMQEAQQAAAETLGRDHVVVATRKINKKGVFGILAKPEFEVIAVEKERERPQPKRLELPPTHPFAHIARYAEQEVTPMNALRTELRGEIRSLRALMSRQNAPSEDITNRALEAELADLRELVLTLGTDPDHDSAAKRWIGKLGIEGLTAKAFARKLKGAGDEKALRAALRELVEVGPWPIPDEGRAVIGLVGPTGVGKTTTAAKLAAHAIFNKKKTVTLVTCDGYRVGAKEQMARYANLLGAEFQMARQKSDLVQILAEARTDIVIVDTAGRGPAEPDGVETALTKIKAGKAGPYARFTLLCLPAAVRDVDARTVSKFFSACKPTGLVITKLDETTQPAGILHAAVSSRLPISAICFGQRVPEDIAAASYERLSEALVGKSDKRGSAAS